MSIVLNKISKSNVVDTVIEQLLDLLLEGKLKVGDRLPAETELAAQVGVGRNSIREAMKVLQVLGILERRQGDGSYISSSFNIPFDSLLFSFIGKIGNPEELVELRRVLEIGVMEIVVEKATEEDFELLEEKVRILDNYARMEPIPIDQAIKADMAFHLALIDMTRNGALEEFGKLIMRLFQASMINHIATPQGIRRAVEDHRAILASIRTRDREKARAMIINSLIIWKEFIHLRKT